MDRIEGVLVIVNIDEALYNLKDVAPDDRAVRLFEALKSQGYEYVVLDGHNRIQFLTALINNKYGIPEGEYGYIKHPGAALAVPITKDNKVIILRQYRFAVSRYLLEFPAGTLEIGDTRINSIRREIQEETGFSANKWDELGTLVPAPGYADEQIYLFLARNLNKLTSEVKGDLDEDIEVLILDPNELDNLISSGDEILDAKTVTAWVRAKQFLDKL